MKFVVFTCLTFVTFLTAASAIKPTLSPVTTLLEKSSLQNSVLIDKPMIVGGELAAEGDWPWVAALVYSYSDVNNPQKSIQHVSCGASFIGNRWVLTAAHCVDGAQIDSLKVSIGTYDLSNVSEPKATRRIYIHPDYNAEIGLESDNDIALIELAEPLEQSKVTLLTDDETSRLALENTLATVIGWGTTVAYSIEDLVPDSSLSNQLLQVELTLLSNEQCKDKLVQAYEAFYNSQYSPEQVGISDNMICAYSPSNGKGSCQGDSGGPLLVSSSQGWQQIGIVSHGVGCGQTDFPDVYTRISKFTDWIKNITQGVEFEADYDFTITPQYHWQTKLLGVTNHSDLTANLTFSLVTDDIANNGFSFSSDNCTTLEAKGSCQVLVGFDAQTIGHQAAKIVIDSSDEEIATSEINITAQAVAMNTSIEAQLTNELSDFLWFTGGDQPWQLATDEAAIVSGELTDGQQSSVLLTFSGAGTLSFDWAVSSEVNSLELGKSFDALYLIVDDEPVGFISGEVAYTQVNIENLDSGNHQILWLYQKNNFITEGEDKAYIKNINFTAKTQADNNETKSTGGPLYGTLWLLFFVVISRLFTSSKLNKPSLFWLYIQQ